MVNETRVFTCEKCEYETPIKCNYDKHLLSKRHLGLRKEVPEYYECIKCNFKTPNSYNYKVHMKSSKHLGLKGAEKLAYNYDDIKHNMFGVKISKLIEANNEDIMKVLKFDMKDEFDSVKEYIAKSKASGLKLGDYEHLKTLMKNIYHRYHFTYIVGDNANSDEDI